MVSLSAPDARSTFDQLEIVMCQWRRIEALLDVPGPFIYMATRSALELLRLDEAGLPTHHRRQRSAPVGDGVTT